MTQTPTPTTTDLAAWYRMSRVAVLKRLRKAKVRRVGTGPHGVALWDFTEAHRAMRKTRGA